MSEIFRIYLDADNPLLMDRPALRGLWEAAVLEQGGTVVAGGVTVRPIPFTGKVMVAGRAERPVPE